MLFCRLKNSRYPFLYCLLFVCSIHLFFLLMLFIKRGADTIFLSVNTSRKAAEIIFIPSRNAPPLAQSMQLGAHASAQAVVAKNSGATAEVMTVKPKTTVQKKAKKEVATPKKEAPKKTVKESSKKDQPKKEVQKKVDDKKKVVQHENECVKNAEMPASVPLKASPIQDSVSQSVDGARAIHATKQEIQAYEQMQFLQQKVSEVWRPPLGLPAGTECSIACGVDTHGKVHTTTVEKSSGILMFDLTAKKAVHGLEFPIWVRGSNVIILFKL
jgi:TonB C terminal